MGFLLIPLLIILSDHTSPSDPNPFIRCAADRVALIADLKSKWALADPSSPEANLIARTIDKIERESSRRVGEFENPGAFLEALAEIKTAFDGTTYPPNYLIRELRKARQGMRKPLVRLPWVERGPGNVDGRARAVIVDPDDPNKNTWFVASVGGGIWKTTNAGRTWMNKTSELKTLSTTTMAMAGSNRDVIYAGTGMGYGRVVDLAGSGVWKTTDRGETWFQLQSTADGQILQAINRIVVDPEDEDVVLVCSNDTYTYLATKGGSRRSGIFRSTDGGDSWVQVYDPDVEFGPNTDNRIQQIIPNPENFNTLYASMNEVGVIKSTDAGQTWFISAHDFALPMDIGTGDGTYRGISVRSELAIAPTDTARIYAAVERPRGVADLYMSTDAGVTWTIVDDTGDDPNWFNAWGRSGIDGSYTAGWFDNTIAVHPYDRNVVFVGGVNLYRIDIDEDRATRTTRPIAWWLYGYDLPYAHADHHFLVMIPEDRATRRFRILDANDAGLAVSTNGGEDWNQLWGMRTTQFYGVDKKPGENAYIGGMQDNGTYQSFGEPGPTSMWRFVLGGDGFETVWNREDPELILASLQYNALRRSTDGGDNWTPLPEAYPGASPFLTKIGHSKADPDLVFTVGEDGIKRSDDFGLSWTLTEIEHNWIGWRAFDNVEVSIANPQIVWISSRIAPDTYYGVTGGIHVSSDGGFTFTGISDNLPSNLTEASGIGTHPSEESTAYMLFSAPGHPKIMRTTDLGRTWEDLSGFGSGNPESNNGFPDVAVFSLLVMPHNPNILWAGTEIGLFISSDNGRTWSFADNGLPTAGIFQMSIVDGQIIVATQGRGVWTVDIPELSGYRPPEVTLSPRLHQPFMPPHGQVSLGIDLRSAYDSTHVLVDDAIYARLDSNASAISTFLHYPVVESKTIRIRIRSYKDGREYKSASRDLDIFPVQIMNSYANDLNAPGAEADFAGMGYAVEDVPGFSSPAIHTPHPYPNHSETVIILKNTIRVAAEDAVLQYKDIAIVEPGRPGSVYGDDDMWDYVVVEGTTDGLNWVPLGNGYDVRAFQYWINIYKLAIAPDERAYKTRRIDLHDTFEPGDLIAIRFRMFADGGVNSWGWAIDDIAVQEPDFGRVIPDAFFLSQNYPNPFNSSTEIQVELPEDTRVRLKIYDVRGREIATLMDGDQEAGIHTLEWAGTDRYGWPVPSGVYLYRIETASYSRSRRMLVIR